MILLRNPRTRVCRARIESGVDGRRGAADAENSLVTISNPLKRLKTAMGKPRKKLAWAPDWRRIRLTPAQRAS
jgi:hypothetical protein